MTSSNKPLSATANHETPGKPIVSTDLKTASDELKAMLAEKRARRQAQWSLGQLPQMEELSLPDVIQLTEEHTNAVLEDANPKIVSTVASDPIPTLMDVVEEGLPPNTAPEPRFTPAEIRTRVEAMREEIDILLPELQAGWTDLTADEVVESIANMQTQEQDWERLSISEIKIPRQEISIWSGFMKMFNQGFTERAAEPRFEKWDIYELKIQKFDFFHITRIRKSEKDSLTFCVVQSQIHGHPNSYTFEVMVRLPLREWGTLEVYLNRDGAPKLINQWKIEQVFLRKNPDERKKKGGIFRLLGI